MNKSEIKFISLQPSKEKIFYVYSDANLTSVAHGSVRLSQDLIEKLPDTLSDYLNSCKDEINNLIEGIQNPILSIKPLEAGGITLNETMVFRAMVEGILIQFFHEKNYRTYRLKSKTITKTLGFKKTTKELCKITNIEDFPDWWSSFPVTYKELALNLITVHRLCND